MRDGATQHHTGLCLSAKWVVLTVGPVWYRGGEGGADLLASCYTQSLARADEVGATGVAFPKISTGAYGYRIELATLEVFREIDGWRCQTNICSLG
jgi:O-acetyl-ADP-ribose deacetylase (regulator of RNase III)